MAKTHLSLDEATAGLLKAAEQKQLALVRYDNPETEEDDYLRFIQPLRIVQAKDNLLALTWQHAPTTGYRLLRLNYFLDVVPIPYAALVDASATFTLDQIVPWASVHLYQRGERPYDLRSARRADAEDFYKHAIRHTRYDGRKLNLLEPPEPLRRELHKGAGKS